MCKAIDKKFFANQDVADIINKNFVPLKIDISEEKNEFLQEQFNIIGAPVINIVNIKKDKELQRWGAELYDLPVKEFIEKLTK